MSKNCVLSFCCFSPCLKTCNADWERDCLCWWGDAKRTADEVFSLMYVLKEGLGVCALSEATTGLLWRASRTSPSPRVRHRTAQPHVADPDWEALREPSSSPWERACLPLWEETREITCHFKFLTANPLSFSHSGNCRVKSRREQLDMWMGGGGCSSLVCPASTVSDWLDWLSYLGLGRFKIAVWLLCFARRNEPCWYRCALLTAAAAIPKCSSLPPSLTHSPTALPAAGLRLHSPRACALPSRCALVRLFGGGGSRAGGEEGQAS